MNDTSKRPLRFFRLGFWSNYFNFKDEIFQLAREYESDLGEQDLAYILRQFADEIDPFT